MKRWIIVGTLLLSNIVVGEVSLPSSGQWNWWPTLQSWLLYEHDADGTHDVNLIQDNDANLPYGSPTDGYLLVGDGTDWQVQSKAVFDVRDYGTIDGTADDVQIQAAIDACKAAGGGVVLIPAGTYILESPLDMTQAAGSANQRGIIVRGVGGGTTAGGTRLEIVHTGAGFDCVGARYNQFENFCVKGDPTTTPTVGFLMARLSTAGSAGEHTFRNIVFDAESEFSVANVYSYASEIIRFYDCIFENTYAGAANVLLTQSNISSLSSTFQTIATGGQSNTVYNFYGCMFVNKGGTASDCLYLDKASDVTIYGGFMYCSTPSTANGRAYVYIDTTNGSSNYLTFTGIRGEPGTYLAEYGVYIGDTAATGSGAVIALSIQDCRWSANTALLYAHDDVQMYDLHIRDTSGPISVKLIRDSNIQSGTYTLRSGGTSSNTIVTGVGATFTAVHADGIYLNQGEAEIDGYGNSGTTYWRINDLRSTVGDAAGILMGTTASGKAKTLIAHEETGANGVGRLVFALDAVTDDADVTLSDEKFSMSNTGAFATTTIELGHASDTTISRVSAGQIAVENKGMTYTASVEVSSAEILALNATPKTLVAAQGADTVIEFVSAILIHDAGTAYVEPSAPDDLVIEYSGGQDMSASIDTTGFLTVTDDEVRLIPRDLTALPITTDLYALKNQAIQLLNTGDALTTGDGTMTIKVTYRVHTLGL